MKWAGSPFGQFKNSFSEQIRPPEGGLIRKI
jgi:hypothetical protein